MQVSILKRISNNNGVKYYDLFLRPGSIGFNTGFYKFPSFVVKQAFFANRRRRRLAIRKHFIGVPEYDGIIPVSVKSKGQAGQSLYIIARKRTRKYAVDKLPVIDDLGEGIFFFLQVA